ncbi:MAG: hypothetical protein AMXMBFR53_36660 [Gemmatimonadota bacterium]
MMAHMKGTGPLAFPAQDPAELRAIVVREHFERIRNALAHYSGVYSKYSARMTTWDAVANARDLLGRRIAEAQGTVLEALEEAEAKVIHDRRGA